jgi:NAD(P)-dependent dehydrogenase (short-subunit alcohol dehydrogenase family)
VSKVAVVTGSSRGIGRGIALTLAEDGYHVVVNYAGNEAAAAETAAACLQQGAEKGHSVESIIVKADIGEEIGRRHLLDETRQKFGRIDLLVNNAGITSIGRADLLDATEEAYDRLMAVNLKGPFFLSQAAAKWMIEETKLNANYRPKIVTISSISGYAVSVNRGDYCMAKAALGMMTKLFAVRLAEHGINVYEICPGIIASDMTAPVKEKYDRLIGDGLTPIRRWGMPEDVGKAVAAIADDRFSFSTGEVFNVDGGFHIRQL